MPNVFKKLLQEHPTLIFTLSYLLITVIGVLYSYFFYQQFNLNILKFADLSDFLLISILEPRSIVVFMVVVITMMAVMSFDYYLRRQFKGYGEFVKNKFKSKYTDPLATITLLLILTPNMLSHLAYNNARDIKNGEADVFEVRLADSGEHPATQQLVVLGTSSRYGYFYHLKSTAAFVVPLENISYMRKVEVSIP